MDHLKFGEKEREGKDNTESKSLGGDSPPLNGIGPPMALVARPELGPVFGQPVKIQPYQPPANDARTQLNPQVPGITVPGITLDPHFRNSSSPLFQAFVFSHDRMTKGEV